MARRFFGGLAGNFNLGAGSGINYQCAATQRLGNCGKVGSKICLRGGYQWVDISLADMLSLPGSTPAPN